MSCSLGDCQFTRGPNPNAEPSASQTSPNSISELSECPVSPGRELAQPEMHGCRPGLDIGSKETRGKVWVSLSGISRPMTAT